MKKLPPEIIGLIASFADDDVRRQLLTVSRSFQAAVERTHFREFHCVLDIDGADSYEYSDEDSDEGTGGENDENENNSSFFDGDRFLAMYRGRRSRFLRHITVTLQLPYLEHKPPNFVWCRESRDEIRAKNELTTSQLKVLFTAIKELESQEAPTNDKLAGISLRIETPFQHDDEVMLCDHTRYHSWWLYLLDPQTLPKLSSIRTLIIGEEDRPWNDWACRYEYPLDLAMVAHLISQFPELEILNFVPS
jgi:hypothetical protein